MQAIKATGINRVATFDPNDSTGIIDSHFPDADFFTEFERFDRHVDTLRRTNDGRKIDYVSIFSPSYLHDSHMRFALRSGANAICEKPLILNPWNIVGLVDMERDTGNKINTILQLRLHPAIIALRERVRNENSDTKHKIDLTYIIARGYWFLQNWKSDVRKSGGIASNIRVHFFDILYFIFGNLQDSVVHLTSATKAAGYLEYEHARVRWFLSVDVEDVPAAQRETGQRTYRSITVDGDEIEFSGGFTDLRTRSYEEIFAGRGYGLEENQTAISAVAAIRGATIAPLTGDYHPFLKTRGA